MTDRNGTPLYGGTYVGEIGGFAYGRVVGPELPATGEVWVEWRPDAAENLPACCTPYPAYDLVVVSPR